MLSSERKESIKRLTDEELIEFVSEANDHPEEEVSYAESVIEERILEQIPKMADEEILAILISAEDHHPFEVETARVEARTRGIASVYPAFSRPFSFDGRIGRTEFGISFIIYILAYIIIRIITGTIGGGAGTGLFIILLFPLQWFLWAQGAKRCHDIGISGWYQLIPFFVIYLMIKAGQAGQNEYGEDPKALDLE